MFDFFNFPDWLVKLMFAAMIIGLITIFLVIPITAIWFCVKHVTLTIK
jgi:uncharacterized membrane protein